MFILNAERGRLTVQQKEPVTCGSGPVYRVRFQFSRHWEGLKAIAVFKAGDTAVTVLLDKSGMCRIPWKVLTTPGVQLQAGVYGTKAGSVVLPTLWAGLGTVLEGTADGGGSIPEIPWEQALEGKQDRLTGLPGQVVGFDREGRAEAQDLDLTADHAALTHRDEADQHPMGAITGLEEALAQRLAVEDAMSAAEIMKIVEE